MSRRLRTVSTARLLAMLGVVVLVAAAASAIAVAASRGGPTPPAKPLAQAIEDAVTAPKVDGVTARVSFTNTLLPSGALTGRVGSALMSGATGRLWVTNDGRGRLELQSNAGDTQVLWDTQGVTVYDASSHTAYKLQLPKDTSAPAPTQDTPPTIQQVTDFLTRLAGHANVSAAAPSNLAGQPAYTVSVSPKSSGGLLGSVELAWDAGHGVPLRIALYARGSSSPVLELVATEIAYGTVSSSDLSVSVPSDAKIVDLTKLMPTKDSGSGSTPAVTGLAAVQAAAPFPVVAPDTIGGLARGNARLVGGKTVVVSYGEGLGTVVVVEHAAAGGSTPGAGTLGSLPTVSIDGVAAHELATQLGTVLHWQRGSVSYTLAGSVPAASAEAAARDLR